MADEKTDLEKKLDEYRKAGYNIVLPTEQIFQISPLQKIHFEVIRLDPNPDNGDVYTVGAGRDDDDDRRGGKFGLGKGAIDKFANATGLIFVPEHSGRVDNGQNANIAMFRSVAVLRKPDNTFATFDATYEVDVAVLEAELRFKYERRKNKEGRLMYNAKQVEEKVTKEGLRLRRFKTARAETGAQSRVVRKILALKSSYTKAEIEKPFVVPKVSLDMDKLLGDPQTRAEVIRQAIGADAQIFGGHALPPGDKRQIDVADFTEIAPIERALPPQAPVSAAQPTQPKREEKMQAATAPAFKNKQELIDYYGPRPIEERRQALKNLLEEKALALPRGWTIDALTDARIYDALWHYQQQPSVKK